MTDDQAEEIFMAWQLGVEIKRSKIAHALLLLKAREEQKIIEDVSTTKIGEIPNYQ